MATAQDRLQMLAQAYAIAWSSHDPDAVAGFFAEGGEISINRGEAHKGRAAIAEMARGFYADFPDLEVRCDLMRRAGDHAIFVWTLEGHHAQTGNRVITGGWEEWELTDDYKIARSLKWFDAADYQRQIDGD
ncbi:conserved hypothetical protein [Cribrihabitans marinus]|uniref:SnoaL-like domain-containing protein n=1 Tax=Cribrihabitans marinus TaxID=1227549 RepID=A0A1H6VVD2_9RHOB|nr:nuclear transport factor 2 family protein [Cribrihabitans marinus]GGH25308.1 hypothetical protein GCM10010973_12390 [Cribrihabitans marinus]SEJ07014.1 conserved hypothetical protein [Cribrihabitans marinus]